MTASPQSIAGSLGWAQRGRGRSYDVAASRFPLHVELVTRIEAHHVADNLGPGLWLDIGAGTGRLAKPLTVRQGARIVAFDPSFDMLSHGMGKRPPGEREWPRLVTGLSSDSLPFRDAVFDGAYCFGVLNRFSNWQRIVAPVHAALKPGARFVFNNRCIDAIRLSGDDRPPHYGYVELASLDEVLTSLGLTLVKALPSPLLSPGFLWGWWQRELESDKAHRSAAVFALKVWLDRTLGLLDDWQDWIEVEVALAGCLPLDVARQVVIVAMPLNGEARPARAWQAPGSGGVCAERLDSVFRDPDLTPFFARESHLRLLSFLAPVLDHAAGEKDFLVRILPGCRHAIDSYVNEIRACMAPSLAVRMRYEAEVRGRAIGQKARGAAGRLQRVWSGEL